jgi:GNAT superfamily N-acetyltransferase
MPLSIRRASPDDVVIITEFNRRLAAESEGLALDPATLRTGVLACLADPIKGDYFLAEESGAAIGQIGLTREFSDWRNGWLWWIQSVYVRQEARRRGVFTALFEHVERLARSDPEVIGLRLYMERDNEIARQTYLRHGMQTTGYVVFEKYPLGEDGVNAIQRGDGHE